MLRGLIKILLGNLHNYDSATAPFKFSELTLLDKVMACKILKFTIQITEAYEKLDLKNVYSIIKDFAAIDITDYYLDISRQRLLLQEGQKEHLSSQMVYSKLLVALIQACAPVIPLTAQEAYQHMQKGILSDNILPLTSNQQMPPTIYQLKWLRNSAKSLPIDPDFLQRYETFEYIDALATIRRKLLQEIQLEPVWGTLKHNTKRAEIVFIRKGRDKIQIDQILDIL